MIQTLALGSYLFDGIVVAGFKDDVVAAEVAPACHLV